MLGSFIRLVDYMLVEALVDRTVGTVEELVAMLEAPRASADKTHKVWQGTFDGLTLGGLAVLHRLYCCPCMYHVFWCQQECRDVLCLRVALHDAHSHEPAARCFAVCHAVLAVLTCHMRQLWAVSSPAAAYQ